MIHPDYVLAQLDAAAFAAYAERRALREQAAYRHVQDALVDRKPYVALKDAPPFAPEHETAVYLDPTCRAQWSAEKQSWTIVPPAALAQQAELAPPRGEQLTAVALSAAAQRHEADAVESEADRDAENDDDNNVSPRLSPAVRRALPVAAQTALEGSFYVFCSHFVLIFAVNVLTFARNTAQ